MTTLAELILADGHSLKTWPEYFEAIWDGRKTFDIRVNDRGFLVGCRLNLIEYDPEKNDVSGRVVRARVPYILSAKEFPGLREGYVCMTLADVEKYTFR
jgi:hypothetical protein